ncbi:hypothetical protein FBR05_10160 [Deltaproteobacteria bacterium PRO3]|nr:hypothetical protein [Deltaproteobacteria bacterium PRO3]
MISTSSLHDGGPNFPPDLTPVVSRLSALGIDPDAYFEAHPPPPSGTNRADYIRSFNTTGPGARDDATIRDDFALGTVDQYLTLYRQKNIPPSEAFADLRARGLISPGTPEPVDTWPTGTGTLRMADLYGGGAEGRQMALSRMPHTGSPPNAHSSIPTSDLSASLVDLGDRSHPAPGSLRASLNQPTAAGRREALTAATRRLEITNQWMEYATRPTTGTPPGLGYTREQAQGVLQNMGMLDATGRPTSFDVNTGAHNLFNIPATETVSSTAVFNPSGSITPRAPGITTRAADGSSVFTPIRMGGEIPAHTGVPDPLTQGAIDYVRAHPPASSAAGPEGGSVGSPTATGSGSPGSVTAPVAGAPASSVTPVGPALTGRALRNLEYRVEFFRTSGRPIPASLAATARASGINLDGLTLAAPTGPGTAGSGPGVGDPGGGSAGVGGTGGGATGAGGPGAPTGPFAPVPAEVPPTRPASGPLAGEWDRMRTLGFTDAQIAEYQRQHPGRDDAAINGSFLRPDGTEIPASERPALVARVSGEIRTGMIDETARGLYEASRAQNIQPPITMENARLMAEQLYRERAGTGSADPTLDQMLGVRTGVAEDVHWYAEPSNPARFTGDNPPGLLIRTAAREENLYYDAIRSADSNGYWRGANGQAHLRGFISRDGGRGPAIFRDPAALRAARTGGTPPLAERAAAYRAMPADQRTAVEGAVRSANPPDTPDFSRITNPAERGRAEVEWQRAVIGNNWTNAREERNRGWAVADHYRDRGEAVEDRDLRDAEAYAQARMAEDMQREQIAANLSQQFMNNGFQVLQEQQRQINQLTLQQLQAMFAINQQLIAQGTPKPFDIVMGMLQGGRR